MESKLASDSNPSAPQEVPPLFMTDETTETPPATDGHRLERPSAEQSRRPKEKNTPPARRPAISPEAREKAWALARQLFESDGVMELPVVDCNKGGLLVDWNGLQGFVPASQLIDFPYLHVAEERLQELQRRRNQRLQLKIIELEPDSRRLIWSERAALIAANERHQLLDRLCPGDRLDGRVTNLTDFGVFVDLGGVEGLIHISELSWMRVSHPGDILLPGEAVTVLILAVNREEGRVALSLKRLRRDPWERVDECYQSGEIVKGVVSNVVDYGAFVLLADGLEGLIHISQLAEEMVTHPGQLLQKGDEVTARVLEVDGAARRLALSLRQV
jgi:small subunit ribosomal protein S1